MIRIEGKYYDGKSSLAHPASMEIYEAETILRWSASTQHLGTSELSLNPRLGNTPRQLAWGTEEKFVTLDHGSVEAFENTQPHPSKDAWINTLEQSMPYAIAAAIVLVAFSVAFAVWGVPGLASAIAFEAPVQVSDQLGESTLSTIDQILDPSELTQRRQSELTAYFQSHNNIPHIAFRDAEQIGANALTLSATTIVFTDQLVELAATDEQLLAVYLHEVGHAELRHVERTILQNSAWLVLLSVIVGDFSGAGELILTLPLIVGQAAYSRSFEREADEYAIEALKQAGVQPTVLADILESLQNQTLPKPEIESDDAEVDEQDRQVHSDNSKDHKLAQRLLIYLSSHPATSERSAYIRAAAE